MSETELPKTAMMNLKCKYVILVGGSVKDNDRRILFCCILSGCVALGDIGHVNGAPLDVDLELLTFLTFPFSHQKRN